MIISNLQNSGRIESLHPLFKKLFDYVKTHDLLHTPCGRIELEGDKLFINNVNPTCVTATWTVRHRLSRRPARSGHRRRKNQKTYRKSQIITKQHMIMKRFFSLTLGLLAAMASQAADTIYTKAPQIPILLERNDNVLFYMRILSAIKSVKLYYSGTEAPQDRGKKRFAPVEYISSHTPGKTLAANPSYSIKKDECQPTSHTLTLKGNQNLFPGINFFWVSLEMQPNTNLNTPITAEITQAVADGKINPVKDASESPVTRRLGVGVRHAGDDGSAAFRIPGLVTTNKGTLLGVYDVRYNNSTLFRRTRRTTFSTERCR